MNLDQVTPIIVSYNEAANLERTLSALCWAKRIVLIDDRSTDGTVEIAKRFPNVVILFYQFDNHTNKWNHAIEQSTTSWVLTLDADYVCPPELPLEISGLDSDSDVFYARFVYCISGYTLRSSLYPPRAVLFQPKEYQYVNDGHTQILDDKQARKGSLHSLIRHDDRKPMSHWLRSQICYAQLEAEKLHNVPIDELGWKDRIRRRIVFAPALTTLYCLFVKGLLLDGWPGWLYVSQRTFAELLLSILLLEQKLLKRNVRD